MRIDELELAHRHHEEVLREAENELLARRLREERRRSPEAIAPQKQAKDDAFGASYGFVGTDRRPVLQGSREHAR
jgi:hypothetical protein